MSRLYSIEGGGDDRQPIGFIDAAILAGYTRTSWDNHDRIEAQREAIEEWADANGFEIVGYYDDDGVSGKVALERRPGLLRAVMAIEDGTINGLVVRSMDRLARDVIGQEIILAAIWRAGGTVYTRDLGLIVQDEADSFERRSVRLAIARRHEDRRMETAEALRRGRARKAARRGYIGGKVTRPYGMELVDDFPRRGQRNHRPIPAEQAQIARMHQMRADGISYQRIADTLNQEGIPTVTGVPWSRPVIWGIIKQTKDPKLAKIVSTPQRRANALGALRVVGGGGS